MTEEGDKTIVFTEARQHEQLQQQCPLGLKGRRNVYLEKLKFPFKFKENRNRVVVRCALQESTFKAKTVLNIGTAVQR